MSGRERALACACVVVCDKSSPSRVAAHASNKGVDGRREEREGQEGGRAQWRKGPEREREEERRGGRARGWGSQQIAVFAGGRRRTTTIHKLLLQKERGGEATACSIRNRR